MLSFTGVRINQNNLYEYLKSHKEEIEAALRSDQRDKIQSIDEIRKDGHKVVVKGTKLDKDGNPKSVTILSLNCRAVDIHSEIFSGERIFLDRYIVLNVQEIFEYNIIDTKGLVYALHADTSEDSWSVDYTLFGVFSNFKTASKIASEKQSSISVFYMDEKTSIYIGGYAE